MCKEMADHEIHADEIEDVEGDLFILEIDPDEAEATWQMALRGCYE